MDESLFWGVVRLGNGPARPAARVGERAIPLAELGVPAPIAALPALNAFIQQGRDAWRGATSRESRVDSTSR